MGCLTNEIMIAKDTRKNIIKWISNYPRQYVKVNEKVDLKHSAYNEKVDTKPKH